MRFEVPENSTEPSERPHMVPNEYFDESAVDFWLGTLGQIEETSREEDLQLKLKSQELLKSGESREEQGEQLDSEEERPEPVDQHAQGAGLDMRTGEERENEAELVWLTFGAALGGLLLTSLLFVCLCLCCCARSSKSKRRVAPAKP